MRVEALFNNPSPEAYPGVEVGTDQDVVVVDSSNPSFFNVVKEGLKGIIKPVHGKIVATSALVFLAIAVVRAGDIHTVDAGIIRSAPLGDMDCNRNINGIDSLLILHQELGLADPKCFFAGDVDGNDLTNSLDALYILHRNAGFIDSFPGASSEPECGMDEQGTWCVEPIND